MKWLFYVFAAVAGVFAGLILFIGLITLLGINYAQ